MDAVKDSSELYEVERQAYHAARPGFRIAELQISPTQKVPWHYHNNVHDTFYVVEGTIRIFLQQPKEEVRLARGQTFSIPVVPENAIRANSREEAESGHHPTRCLQSSICLARLSPTCSSRGASLKSRTFFSGISSILHCGGHHTVCGCVGVTGS